jgi:hypothetical protein
VRDEDFVERCRRVFDECGSQMLGQGTRVRLRGVADDRPVPAGSIHTDGRGHGRRHRLHALEVERDPSMTCFDVIERRGEAQRALMQHGQVVRHTLDFVQEVRREDDGAAFVGHRSDDGLEDIAAHDGVQS